MMKLALVALAGWVALPTPSFAQQQMPVVPMDKQVKMGKLDNGLTYYIRHNE